MQNKSKMSNTGQEISRPERHISDYLSDDITKAIIEDVHQEVFTYEQNLEIDWTEYFTDAVRLIRTSLKEEDILKASVEEVRRVLGCERVVVYGLKSESKGTIVAESVVPGFVRTLGTTIQDPCFDAEYINKYENGRIRATDNIYEAGLNPCYVNQLERLEVKANLVAPIINEGKLLGLLVAHQCSQPRQWHQHEIRWISQIAMQVGFALDNARLLAEAEYLRQRASIEKEWTQYFNDTVKVIHASLNKEDILTNSVEEVRRVLGCERVVVYGPNPDSDEVVLAESVAPGWPKSVEITTNDPCFEAKYIDRYENGRVVAMDNIYEQNLSPCHIEQLEKLSVKSNLVAPIIKEGKLMGLLIAHHCSQPRKWLEHEISWFSQIAIQVGFAIENAKLSAKTIDLREEKDIEAEWTEYFTQTVRLIRASLKEEDIFKTSVEEVRRVIGCDRVVVYGLNAESEGVIIAESVIPGLPRGLGATIKDPCFEARYIEKYQNGRVRATNNIYEAGLSACYVNQLEKLAVKANLVTPIINEGKLLGLLVAHQCLQPYNWQQYEIRWISQIAMQIGFAIDNAKLLAKTSDIRQQTDIESEWTNYFTQTVKLIRNSLNKEDILKTSVEEVRRVLGCDRLVVYGLEAESMGLVMAESVGARWSRSLGVTIEDPCFAARYIDKYQNGRIIAIENIYEASLTPCYIDQLERFEVKANLVAPIIHEGKLMGLLIAHECSQPREWLSYEVRWFSQIATQIGFALENAELSAKTSFLRQEKGTEDEWTKYFTQTVRLIRSSLKEEDILDATVEEVRRILECDSVLVYGLKPEAQGVVIAESVGRRWNRALGITMKDPCLEAKYIEKYRNGRIRVTNNIYEAGFSGCYIEQLEKIDIKANIITPILYEDKLLGLLVANQCSGPREWLPHEVRWLSQIAMQVGFALENAQASQNTIQTYEVLKNDVPVQHSQQEDFQQLITELLKDNENSFKAFSTKALNLSEFVTVALKQIQGVSDGAKGVATTARQAEHQVKRNHQSLQEAQKNVKAILQSISAHQEAVVYGAQKAKQVTEDCQKLSVMIDEVANKLNKQKNSQNINAAIAKSELESNEQELLVSNVEEAENTEEELIETVTQTQSLLSSVTKEIHEISGTMENGSEQTSTWTKSLKNNELQIYHISTINTRAGRLVEKITQAATNQIRYSDEARQHVLSASTLARKISEQSQGLTKWFTQLATFAQENIQKAEFWENIKRFLHSSHTLVTGLTEKK